MNEIKRLDASNAKYRVQCTFFMNGWTVAYYNTKEECKRWLNAMSERHGRITSQEIEEIKGL